MKISPVNLNYKYTFGSSHKDVRKAEHAARKANEAFPAMSPSYVEQFYISSQKRDPAYYKGKNLLEQKVSSIREASKQMLKTKACNDIPFLEKILGVEHLKAGNCSEKAIIGLMGLLANGYDNSEIMELKLKVVLSEKNSKKVLKTYYINLDHNVVLTDMNNKDRKGDNLIVVDPWMGFCDTLSGAKARYKNFVYKKELKNEKVYKGEIYSYINYYIFELNTTGSFKRNGYDIDDIDVSSNIILEPSYTYNKKELNALGEWAKNTYPELLINSKKN